MARGLAAMPLAAIALAPFKLRRKSNIPFDHAVGNSRRENWKLVLTRASRVAKHKYTSSLLLISFRCPFQIRFPLWKSFLWKSFVTHVANRPRTMQ